MDSTAVSIIMALALALASPAVSKTSASSFVQQGTATKCGETLRVTDYARIEYKLGEHYDSFEVCPWTIRVEGAANLRFELESDGFGADVTLNVATVEKAIAKPTATLLHVAEMPARADPVTLPGSVAIVTFNTFNSQNGTGFVMNIGPVGTSDIYVSPSSVDQIRSTSFEIWDHPPVYYDLYDNNELSTFIVAPKDYSSPYDNPKLTHLTYTEHNLEQVCKDVVDVWNFGRNHPGKWKHVRLFCGGDESGQFHFLESMALVTFSSDETHQGYGFSASHKKYYE